MKTTVITHFWNEEILLPYWLKHHLELFDHGILINYRSTDKSVEIIKELAPHQNSIALETPGFSRGEESAIYATVSIASYYRKETYNLQP